MAKKMKRVTIPAGPVRFGTSLEVRFADWIETLVNGSAHFNKNHSAARSGYAVIEAAKRAAKDGTGFLDLDVEDHEAIVDALDKPRTPWRDGLLIAMVPYSDAILAAETVRPEAEASAN